MVKFIENNFRLIKVSIILLLIFLFILSFINLKFDSITINIINVTINNITKTLQTLGVKNINSNILAKVFCILFICLAILVSFSSKNIIFLRDLTITSLGIVLLFICFGIF